MAGRPARLGLGGLGAAAIFAFATSACGGSSNAVAQIGSGTTTTTVGASAVPGSPGSKAAGAVAYSACMRAHGVADFPDPVVNGGHISLTITPGLSHEPRFASAQAACQHLLGAGPAPQSITAAQQADYLKAAACMRAHGIAGFPDPVFTAGKVLFPLPAGMNANSSHFEAAREICQKLIPAGLPYSN